MTADLSYSWRDDVSDAELHELTVSHGGEAEVGWWDRVRAHSLGWVTARDDSRQLVGFANVAWDGSEHAFLLDPKVRPDQQRRGIATQLVRRATDEARGAGCTWLHVDFVPSLRPFYFDACGFTPTDAGVLRLA